MCGRSLIPRASVFFVISAVAPERSREISPKGRFLPAPSGITGDPPGKRRREILRLRSGVRRFSRPGPVPRCCHPELVEEFLEDAACSISPPLQGFCSVDANGGEISRLRSKRRIRGTVTQQKALDSPLRTTKNVSITCSDPIRQDGQTTRDHRGVTRRLRA